MNSNQESRISLDKQSNQSLEMLTQTANDSVIKGTPFYTIAACYQEE